MSTLHSKSSSIFWSPRFRLGWILIFISALNALGWTLMRWSYENSLTHTQITVDYDDTRVMSDAFGLPHSEMLQKLKQHGVTSVALYGMSLSNLRDYGRISLFGREEAARMYPNVPWRNFDENYGQLITTTPQNQALLPQLMRNLKEQTPPETPPQVVLLSPRSQILEAQYGILIPWSKQLMNDAQMGFDPRHVQLIRDAGLSITARFSNALNLDLDRLRSLLDEAQQVGVRVVIFAEDEVLGYSSMIKAVSGEMKERNLLFGNIEFTKQRGWQEFARLSEGQLVRVHSVGGDEAAKVQQPVLVERFARAMKERNIRVAYVRFGRQFKGKYALPEGADLKDPKTELEKEESSLEQNLEMIGAIRDEVRHQPLTFDWLRPGLETEQAQAFSNYPMNLLTNTLGSERAAKWTLRCGRFLSGLGGLGAGLLMLNLFFDLKRRTRVLWVVAGVLFVAILSGSSGMGAKLMALEIGCLFSVIGLLWGGLPQLWRDADAEPEQVSTFRAWLRGARILLQTSAIMMIGPLLIIALLNSWQYFSGADKYLWPKGTQLLPLIFVALAFAAEAFPHRVVKEGAAAAQSRLLQRIREVLARPLTIGITLGSIVLLMAGMIWIARTGNDSGMEISGLELRMRAILEQILITRPRTKEIILGHPAMIFAVYFALRRQWPGFFAAAIATTIGQADMLNTFCHLHTPLFYSTLRSIHALWIGIIVGGVGLWIWTIIAPRAAVIWRSWSTHGAGNSIPPVSPKVNV